MAQTSSSSEHEAGAPRMPHGVELPGAVPESPPKVECRNLLSPATAKHPLQQLRSPVALASSLRRLRSAVAELTPSPADGKANGKRLSILSPKHKPDPTATDGALFKEGYLLKLKTNTQLVSTIHFGGRNLLMSTLQMDPWNKQVQPAFFRPERTTVFIL